MNCMRRLCACQVKVFDPTESSGLRILGEMSYSELQERLGLAKSRAAEKEEERRLTIIEEKRAKQEELKGRVENIVRVRGTSPLAPLVLRLVCGVCVHHAAGCVRPLTVTEIPPPYMGLPVHMCVSGRCF